MNLRGGVQLSSQRTSGNLRGRRHSSNRGHRGHANTLGNGVCLWGRLDGLTDQNGRGHGQGYAIADDLYEVLYLRKAALSGLATKLSPLRRAARIHDLCQISMPLISIRSTASQVRWTSYGDSSSRHAPIGDGIDKVLMLFGMRAPGNSEGLPVGLCHERGRAHVGHPDLDGP